MQKWIKVSLLIIPWIVIIIIALWYFAPYLYIRWAAFKRPEVASARLTPRDLDVHFQLSQRGSYYFENLFFDLPTTQATTRKLTNGIAFNERDGKKVVILKHQFGEKKKIFSGEKGAIMAALAAEKGIRTSYDIERYELSLTLDAISPFQRVDLALATIFFTTKLINTLALPLYSFETSSVKGFQEGKNVALIYINPEQSYSFVFSGHTQQEIDAILRSISVQ